MACEGLSMDRRKIDLFDWKGGALANRNQEFGAQEQLHIVFL